MYTTKLKIYWRLLFIKLIFIIIRIAVSLMKGGLLATETGTLLFWQFRSRLEHRLNKITSQKIQIALAFRSSGAIPAS